MKYYKMLAVWFISICMLFPSTSLPATAINIEVTSIHAKYSIQNRTQKMPNGKFDFVPDEKGTPTGHIELEFTVNGKTQVVKTAVKNVFKTGKDYYYYFIGCDNGNAFQKGSNFFNPFVRNISDYKALDLSTAKRMYMTGDAKQRELAVWTIWKIGWGKQIDEILKDLLNGTPIGKKQAAETIAGLNLYHPLINHEVQKKLSDLHYTPGSTDGVWDNNTIEAIKQFQKKEGMKVTGWLDEATLIKLFSK